MSKISVIYFSRTHRDIKMGRYFSIGEMSKLHMISIQTLRYYDEINLFKPSYVDQGSNYRYYTLEQFSLLDTIKFYKYLDIPLKEIKDRLLDSDDKILELLNRKLSLVEQKTIELDLIKKILISKKEIIEKSINLNNAGNIYRKHIPCRHILSMKYDSKLNEKERIEFSRREIANLLEEKVSIFYGGVGGQASLVDVKQAKKVSYNTSFVIVERELFNGEDRKLISEISEGEFICMAYYGPYKDNYAHFKKIIDYVEYKKIPVEDNIYEVPIIDPLTTMDDKKLLTEIQIKVKKREIDLRCLV